MTQASSDALFGICCALIPLAVCVLFVLLARSRWGAARVMGAREVLESRERFRVRQASSLVRTSVQVHRIATREGGGVGVTVTYSSPVSWKRVGFRLTPEDYRTFRNQLQQAHADGDDSLQEPPGLGRP